MRAKIIETGEMVSVEPYITDGMTLIYKEVSTTSARTFRATQLDFDFNSKITDVKQIDWELRRFELVKAVLPAAMSIRWNEQYIKVENIVNTAIAYADAVIAKLKGNQV